MIQKESNKMLFLEERMNIKQCLTGYDYCSNFERKKGSFHREMTDVLQKHQCSQFLCLVSHKHDFSYFGKRELLTKGPLSETPSSLVWNHDLSILVA